MNNLLRIVIATLIVAIFSLYSSDITFAQSQKKTSKPTSTKSAEPSQTLVTEEELLDYKKRVASLVSFYEFALNTIGNDSTAAEDKDVIINRSYLKFFVSGKVQIEDDLDENRLIKTYKPVQAYLQDVDFFFKYAQFNLNIEEIKHYFDNPQQPYFKVTLTRFLKAITSKGDTILNSKKRYIEINLDVKQKDIKIASIYTSLLNEEEDQMNWWNSLTEPWKQVFRKEIGGLDSLNLGQIKRLQNTQELNIDNNTAILDLSPLSRFTVLKSLSLANTPVYDLMPIRNLTNIEYLNIEGTLVKNIQPLLYASKIKELNLNKTKPDSTLDLSKFPSLEKFSCAYCNISSVKSISNNRSLTQVNLSNNPIENVSGLIKLVNLSNIDLSATKVSDLEVFEKLSKLEFVNLSSSPVQHLKHLDGLKALKKLLLNSTNIQTLEDLKTVVSLEKIYCDNTAINKQEALEFMKALPNCLVIFESSKLLSWWQNLSPAWQDVFKQYVKIANQPSQEQLVRVVNETEIELSNNKEISDLTPLSILYRLKTLDAQNSAIKDLTPIAECNKLEKLNINNTQVVSLSPLNKLNNLRLLYIENTPLDSIKINNFRNIQPLTNVIYRTSKARNWWTDVPDSWRMVFKKYIPFDNFPSDEHLHAMLALDSLVLLGSNPAINTLGPVSQMDRIKKLKIDNAKITDLSPLKNSQTLQHLDLSKNPIRDILPLANLSQIQHLILENTGISELEPIANFHDLITLNIAGTQVKELDNLEKCNSLKFLDVSSTTISSLKPVEGIKTLELLKCFNTKLSDKKIAKFKSLNTNCEVIFY